MRSIRVLGLAGSWGLALGNPPAQNSCWGRFLKVWYCCILGIHRDTLYVLHPLDSPGLTSAHPCVLCMVSPSLLLPSHHPSIPMQDFALPFFNLRRSSGPVFPQATVCHMGCCPRSAWHQGTTSVVSPSFVLLSQHQEFWMDLTGVWF